MSNIKQLATDFWCWGALEDLRNAGGLIGGDSLSLIGVHCWDQIDAEFYVEDADIWDFCQRRVRELERQEIFAWLRLFRDDRQAAWDLLEQAQAEERADKRGRRDGGQPS